MKETIGSRFKRAWNIFMNRDPTTLQRTVYSGISYGYRPDRIRMTRGHERSIITAICNRIGLDVAAISLVHARVDDNGHFVEYIDDTLHQCLTVEANLDQTGRALRQDIVMSMLDEGVVAVVPVEADFDPEENNSYKIYSLRCGKILEWLPTHVRVRLYDERSGQFQEVIVPKKYTAIIENPLFAVMNEPNSTMTSVRLVDDSTVARITGLQPGTRYRVRITHYVSGSSVQTPNIFTQTTSPVAYFSWTNSDMALIAAGQPIRNLTATAWNNLIAKITACRGNAGSVPQATSGAAITANHFNQMRNAIASLNGAGTVAGPVTSGTTKIQAILFANASPGLKEAINRAISVANQQEVVDYDVNEDG